LDNWVEEMWKKCRVGRGWDELAMMASCGVWVGWDWKGDGSLSREENIEHRTSNIQHRTLKEEWMGEETA
jgi:hypothetical protein